MARSDTKNAKARTSITEIKGINMNKLLDELAAKHDQSIPDNSVTSKMLAERLSANGEKVSRRTSQTILYDRFQNGELKRKRIGNLWYYYAAD